MAKLAEVRWILERMHVVLDGRWQKMFYDHLEFQMYFLAKELAEENGLSISEDDLLDMSAELSVDLLEAELGPKGEASLKELKRWLNLSVYARELDIPWDEPPSRPCC